MIWWEWIPVAGPIIARRKSFQQLPELAQRWGLQVIESSGRYMFGVIKGSVQGYGVEIHPDSPMVTVSFNRRPEDFECCTMDMGLKRVRHNLGHPRFERVFSTLSLSPRVADALRGQQAVFERILTVWTFRVIGIHLSAAGLTCTMRTPLDLHYLSVPFLEWLVPTMIEAVRALEAVLVPGDPPPSP